MVSMKMSGTRRLKASQARIREPRDCPMSVKRGQEEVATQSRVERKRKMTRAGSRWMSKRSCAGGGECQWV